LNLRVRDRWNKERRSVVQGVQKVYLPILPLFFGRWIPEVDLHPVVVFESYDWHLSFPPLFVDQFGTGRKKFFSRCLNARSSGTALSARGGFPQVFVNQNSHIFNVGADLLMKIDGGHRPIPTGHDQLRGIEQPAMVARHAATTPRT